MEMSALGRDSLSRGTNGKRSLARTASQWIGWGITIACLVYIVRQIDPAELRTALSHFSWPYLGIGLFSLALGYTFRIIRWAVMLRAAGATVSSKRCAAPFLASIAMNNLLPLRVGDVVRALVFPQALGVSKTLATGSLVMERLVDLLTLLVFLGLGSLMGVQGDLPSWLQNGAVLMAFAATTALLLLFLWSNWLSERIRSYVMRVRHAGIVKVLQASADLLFSFSCMSRPSALFALFSLSLLVWAGELGLFWAVLRGFDLDVSLPIAAVVMSIATLSTLAPSSPGYVGPFHLAAFFAIGLLGGEPAQAVSCAIVLHLVLWGPTTLSGVIAILLSPTLFNVVRAGRKAA